MNSQSKLTRTDYEDFLIRIYIGTDQDFFTGCINRAYLDFNRTMHGFAKFDPERKIYNKAVTLIRKSLDDLRALCLPQPMTVGVFDDWHKATCLKIMDYFETNNFHLYVGQAQKWVNMTMKYIFVLGEQRIPGFGSVYPYCHVPIDSILQKSLENYGYPPLHCAWSRMDDYEDYFQRQNWIRQRFALAPLDVEFILWMGQELDT
ncbi:MAG TPA: hypothetical protein ENN32_00140 [Chloroflexi bacterium]|nr:hypothetical protein [Chloroflexota bacterium]